MEEYDYWVKVTQCDIFKRCRRDIRFGDSEARHSACIPSYPLITETIFDEYYHNNFKKDFQPSWTFSSFKAKRTRGDYKLAGWWDKFRSELYDYNGVKDVRGYMLNISPKWPDKYGIKGYTKHLEKAIIKFAKTGKWKEFHYTIESGKNGDHLHAHCVCIPTDPKLAKTYISKGNHSNWFKREFDNPNNKYPVGFVGCVKGRYSIQVVQINNYQIYLDKLDYLQEESKPEDHQNKFKIMDKQTIDFS